jgi:transposase
MPGDAARGYGKSDPIDALAVAGAALREPGLPAARLDGPGAGAAAAG